jgi:hypothetical protein
MGDSGMPSIQTSTGRLQYRSSGRAPARNASLVARISGLNPKTDFKTSSPWAAASEKIASASL